jgi:MATE family, multidrug efflux pump
MYTIFDSINVIFSAAVKGAGDTRFVMYMTVSLAWLVMVVPTYLAVYVLDWGVYSAWWFLSAFMIILSAVFYLRFKGGKWESMRVIEMPPPLPISLPASPGLEEALIEPPGEQPVDDGGDDLNGE